MDAYEATFLADIPTTFAIALGITLLFRLVRRPAGMTNEERATLGRRIDRTVLIATLAFIVFVEIATYFNMSYAVWMMRQWPINETGMTGTEFMWHGYFRWPFPGLCRTLFFEAEAMQGFCDVLEPAKDPFDIAWWPVAILCFYLQYLAARVGQLVGLKIG